MENVCAEIQVYFFENVVFRTSKRAKFATFVTFLKGVGASPKVRGPGKLRSHLE